MSDKLQVLAIPSGPLKIRGVRRLDYCGERVEAGDEVYLCRCGESANMPFCDGSHRDAGFTGANEPRESQPIRVWEGRRIKTFFNPNACMHVLYCKPLKALREAELAGDDAAAAEIARVVDTCPSGALRWEASAEVGAPPRVAEAGHVEVMEGGEVRLHGAWTCENFDLMEGMDGERATLCRCGRSKNKPWCDGRHKGRKAFR
jgi:CDGSH-type Zn-finger protein